MEISGMKVVLDSNLTENGKPYTVKRTWYERLFTRPWRPRQTKRIVVPQVPYKGAMHINDTLIMHPETYNLIKGAYGVKTDRNS
jgi:hypothetical protein